MSALRRGHGYQVTRTGTPSRALARDRGALQRRRTLGATAVVLGRQAVLAQYAPAPARGRPSLFERAERIGGQDGTGWIVYRIAKA